MSIDSSNGKQPWKRNFFTITIGQTISIVGSSAVQFTLIWWIASNTSSPLMLAMAGLFAFLPQLLLGPFAGVWVDRLKRKTVIICADLFIGMVAAVYALILIVVNPPFWSACAVLGIRAIGSVFHTPAIQSVIPLLVPEKELVRVNGWSQFAQTGALMLGPVLGAALYAIFPLPIVLLSDLVGASLASIAVAAVKIPELKKEKQLAPNFRKEMHEGVAVFQRDKKLCIVTLAAALSMIFYMPLSSFFALMASDYFKASAWHASIVQFGYSGGMMLCALLIGAYGRIKKKLFVVHIGLLGLGLTAFFCGLLPQNESAFWLFAALCTFMGASGNLYNIPYIAYMQEKIPREVQGRAFSIMSSLMSATMPLGLLIAGPVAEIYGVKFWFYLTGIAFFIITSISFLLVVSQT